MKRVIEGLGEERWHERIRSRENWRGGQVARKCGEGKVRGSKGNEEDEEKDKIIVKLGRENRMDWGIKKGNRRLITLWDVR